MTFDEYKETDEYADLNQEAENCKLRIQAILEEITQACPPPKGFAYALGYDNRIGLFVCSELGEPIIPMLGNNKIDWV